jgi:beta-glucosidase
MFDPSDALSRMTVDEKAALVTGASMWTTAGVERLGVPSLVLSDGPHGVRRAAEGASSSDIYRTEPATAFPTACATGSSWDPALLEEIGAALADECRALGVDVLLGPGVNIKRSPLCGRNFEYFSEDPVLAGRLAAAWISGLQRGGVGASLKHFAANNQETGRMRVSAEVDERTLREIYFPAFEIAVTGARPASVMCSYNAINGTPASQHEWLLTEILRGDWGFEGFVVSDWGAVGDPVASLRAGLDLEMPGTRGRTAAALAGAVAAGTLSEADLDRAAGRILRATADLRAGHGEDRPGADFARHDDLARRAAAESAVLLTNENGFLPLDPGQGGTLAVIGEFARTPRFQGGGSSHVRAVRVRAALDELVAAVAGRREVVFAPGFTLDGAQSPPLRDEALGVATAAETVVMFLGLNEAQESEGFDRDSMDLPAVQLDLLRAVAAVNPRIAVVLSNGGVVLTHHAEQHARAVLEMWLGGQASGGAAADILLGAAEPGGRLAETIPLALSDNPSYVNFPGTPDQVLYGERHYVGYRWYDKVGREVAHPFGHGLSYTTFGYAGLHAEVPDPARAEATVAFTVTNTGQRAGSDVAQVYVTDVDASADRPERELKAFRKVRLAAGESRRVELRLTERDFAFWDVRRNRWTVEPGTFRIAVGASSRDLRLSVDIDLAVPLSPVPLTLDSTLGEWTARPAARDALRRAATDEDDRISRAFGADEALLSMVASMPLRRVLALGTARISDEAATIMVEQANNATGQVVEAELRRRVDGDGAGAPR